MLGRTFLSLRSVANACSRLQAHAVLSDLFLSLPFCLCVDILRVWMQHRIVEPVNVWARGLFIFIMGQEKLWKPCTALFMYGVVFLFDGEGVNLFVNVLELKLCITLSVLRGGPAGRQACVHCSWANMSGMSTVTEPGTLAHQWLAVIESCPFSAASPELITDTLIVLTMIDEWFLSTPQMT